MNFLELIYDKAIKPKEKIEIFSQWMLDNPGKLDELIDFAKEAKDPVKATCIEAIEHATRIKPEIATNKCLNFISSSLKDKAPRIKWESARVIGNIAHLYPASLDYAIKNLLENTKNQGTVVRWSASFALGEIVRLNTEHNKTLIPAIEAIAESEPKSSIKKIYQVALKKVKK
jgi:HEAT repeat protein